MRKTQIFSGSSHPGLVSDICDRLGCLPAKAELSKFSNGETKVQLNTSIREQDVFVVQSGSDKINDSVMELLIMVSACKSGSSKSVTAVMPYFPYSRQSKMKSHRGSITARMIANLLDVAGVNHVITIDLHASQMQGFFHCPVDNLVAEPLIVHWIKMNIPDWKRAVVVSKNPGGTKRVTSLADALKLYFGIVMTDRRRPGSGRTSVVTSTILPRDLDRGCIIDAYDGDHEDHNDVFSASNGHAAAERDSIYGKFLNTNLLSPNRNRSGTSSSQAGITQATNSPLYRSTTVDDATDDVTLTRIHTAPSAIRESEGESSDDDEIDPRTRDVVTGRLIHGHIVDDDVPSPSVSTFSVTTPMNHPHDEDDEHIPDHMINSFMSTASSIRPAGSTLHTPLGGTGEAGASSDDEEDHLKNPELESTVTLVGNVRNRPVLIVDDMIDKSASWIAAAETVVKRGGATKVYCIATHGLFGGNCLQEMEECDCVDAVVVSNSFPISEKKRAQSSKLHVMDVSGLLAEAIRRNYHGESMERLFVHYDS